jgi:AcrR family transcriptional regulator
MAPEERREAIIRATLPLLLEQGPELSTSQIAQAAGVAEGTIFRAFETKQDLIHATIHAALRPDTTIECLAGLPAQPLAERVEVILDLLRAEMHRTRSIFLHFARRDAPPPPPPPAPSDGPRGPFPGARPPFNPHDNKALIQDAVTAAMDPYSGELAVAPSVAAKVLSALSFASLALAEDEPLSHSAELAQVVLHGIAKGDS